MQCRMHAQPLTWFVFCYLLTQLLTVVCWCLLVMVSSTFHSLPSSPKLCTRVIMVIFWWVIMVIFWLVSSQEHAWLIETGLMPNQLVNVSKFVWEGFTWLWGTCTFKVYNIIRKYVWDIDYLFTDVHTNAICIILRILAWTLFGIHQCIIGPPSTTILSLYVCVAAWLRGWPMP